MARHTARPAATVFRDLQSPRTRCWACEGPFWVAYDNERTVTTLDGLIRLRLHVRRCHNPQCALYLKPYRPEEEGVLALPHAEFGLDVMAYVGALRYAEHRSVPEIHQQLTARGVLVCERTVTNLLYRYEELLALYLSDGTRLNERLIQQGRVMLGFDGLQPDVGHEVLWTFRDCLSGEVLKACSLLSGTENDLADQLRQIRESLPVPITGVISDGQHSIRNAVAAALPGVPHQLCQFHYLRDAAQPIYEADRHAKKELKKRVRGVRPIERQLEQLEGRNDPEAHVLRGYCLAVRSAITDDGRPPLRADGLKLKDRLQAIHDSIERVAERDREQEKGGCLRS